MNRKIFSQSKLLLSLKQVEIERDNWTEGVKNYQEKCEGWSCTQNGTKDMEGNKRKSKGCYYKAQKKNNLVEVKKKRLIQQKMERQEKRVKKNIEI